MIFSALVLLCCSTLGAGAPTLPNTATAVVVKSAPTVLSTPSKTAEATKPDAPAPKPEAMPEDDSESMAPAGAATPSSASILHSPVRPVTPESYETDRQRKIWYGLVALGHGTAVFDAWTTRRAVSGGYGVEGDPLQRPFAQSGAIYATTQVTPLVLDYVGHRMIRNSHPWIRRTWWIPQTAGASLSLGAGIHNYTLAH